MKKHIANIITGSRIAFSLPLLFIPLSSAWFAILYLVCGLTDMVDGTIARKTGSVSKFGARLDTVADFVFMSVCCVKILPRKAGAHRDLYAPKRIFSRNTAAKSHGQRQPYRGFLPCLSRKSLDSVCFAVLNRRFFFTVVTDDRRNTGCIPRAAGAAVEKKMHSKPCKSLCAPA